jgi:hypothetical protein
MTKRDPVTRDTFRVRGDGARASLASRSHTRSSLRRRACALCACAGALGLLALACAAPAVPERTGANVHEPKSVGGGEQGKVETTSAGAEPQATHADAGQQATRAVTQPTHATDHPVDAFGYAVVGGDEFPALYERVEAIACTNDVPGKCTTDAECGAGFACLCGIIQGLGGLLGGQCVSAECRSGADCAAGGRCLLSLGSRPSDCCAYGHLGFFCSRSKSSCKDGNACVGNGSACIYDDALDGFECKQVGCTCGSP